MVHALYSADTSRYPERMEPEEVLTTLEQPGRDTLETVRERATEYGVSVTGPVATGPPARVILNYADDESFSSSSEPTGDPDSNVTFSEASPKTSFATLIYRYSVCRWTATDTGSHRQPTVYFGAWSVRNSVSVLKIYGRLQGSL